MADRKPSAGSVRSNWSNNYITQLVSLSSSISGSTDAFRKTTESVLNQLLGGALDIPTREEKDKVIFTETSNEACVRTLQTLVIGSIVSSAVGFIPVTFVGMIMQSDDQLPKAIAMACAYLVSLAGVYFLEGGQAVRFLAYNLPLYQTHLLGRAKERLVRDRSDNRDFQIYVGVRQFFTLGTTFANGQILGFISKSWDVTDTALGTTLLISCNLVAVSSLCQLVPQLRSERDIGFANSGGNLLAYAGCTLVGKVFNPAPFAFIVAGAMLNASGAKATSFADTRSSWPPAEVVHKRGSGVACCKNADNWLFFRPKPHTVPAHVICTITQMLLEGWEKGQLGEQDAAVAVEFLRKVAQA